MSATFSHERAGTDEDDWAPLLRSTARLPWVELTAHRIVIVAPHPDDESLGAGGLIAGACAAGRRVTIVSCTDGEAAYGTDESSRARLAQQRPRELAAASAHLGSPTGTSPTLVSGSLPDGALCDHLDALTALIERQARDADLIVSPWPGDGHPDHESVGLIGRAIAEQLAIPLLEYPIWMWHWATPASIDDLALVALPLTAAHRRSKRHAVTAHRSQIERDEHTRSHTPILTTDVLAHFDRDVEVFVDRRRRPAATRSVATTSAAFFDAMYAASPGSDPWDFVRSSTELARYDEIIGALADRSYDSCFEPGCSIGVLSERLTTLSRRVVAMDIAPHAIDEARRRTGGLAGLELRVGSMPEDLPRAEAPFDLIVLSEIGYYFEPERLGDVVDELCTMLARGGRLLAAHWTGSSDDHMMGGEQTHWVIRERVPWPSGGIDRRSTFLLETWDRS